MNTLLALDSGKGKARGMLTIVVIVADDELFELTIFAQLAPNILVKGIKVVLQLRRVHAVLGVVRRVLVQVRHQDRLTVRWFDMFAGAAIAMAAGTDFLQRKAMLAYCDSACSIGGERDWWTTPVNRTGSGSRNLRSKRSS